MKKILIRADGNKNIGYGHIMRSLVLYELLKKSYDCLFIIKNTDQNLINYFGENEINYFKIQKEEEFHERLNSNAIIILDGYDFDTAYQSKIKKTGAGLICIDDMFKQHFVADVVINHAPGIKKNFYSCEHYTKLALGPTYALLRKPFIEAAQITRSEIKQINSVLISFGGADPLDLTNKVLDRLKKVEFLKNISVVLGGAYQHKEKLLKNIENSNKKIGIYTNLGATKMLELMYNNNFGIMPSSSISMEACCAQLPLISGYYTNNQFYISNYYYKNNIAYIIGDFRENVEQIPTAIFNLNLEYLNIYKNNQGKLYNTNSYHNLLNLIEFLN